ncbi:MAG TPA: hypothetical protein VHR72_11585, partial [Gemmataceae bacterium]|nr:hypothetical protein [Gemmataceae bacterium]
LVFPPFFLFFVWCFLGFVAVHLTTSLMLNILLTLKGIKLGVPMSPEGEHVGPSGIWLADDADLEVGDIVLSSTRNGWYRAEVIRLLGRNRVLLHYPGWDPFLDEPRRKRDLQAAIDPKIDAASETSIRAADR